MGDEITRSRVICVSHRRFQPPSIMEYNRFSRVAASLIKNPREIRFRRSQDESRGLVYISLFIVVSAGQRLPQIFISHGR